MPRKTLRYKEGDWFAVPLGDNSYARGRIVRIGRRGGVVLGFFYGPRLYRVPEPEDFVGLDPSSAILKAQFCDPGLQDDSWPIVLRSPIIDREQWSQTHFGYMVDPAARDASCRIYSDEDPFEIVSVLEVSPEVAKQLPPDGLYGHIALQVQLDILLA